MNLRSKLIVLMFVCSVAVLAALSGIAIQRMDTLSESALALHKKSLLDDYDLMIKGQVQTAVSILFTLDARVATGELKITEAQNLGADLLRQLRYLKEGYFWVDTVDGTNVVLLGKSSEGKNRIDLQDNNGTKFIREIIQQGRKEGGGYTDYWFPKAGSNKPLPKRGYSLEFKPWGWVVGTGNYIDDINSIMAEHKGTAQQAYLANIRFFTVSSILAFCGVGLLFFLIVKSDKKTIETAEENLGKSEAKFRQMFNDAPDAYLILNDGVFVDCNKAAENMLKGNKQKIVGMTPESLSPEFQPDGRLSSESVSDKITEAFHSGSNTFEWVHQRFDRSVFWAEITLSSMIIQDNPVLFTCWRNISARKQLENKLTLITDSAYDAILMLNSKGFITFWNPAAVRIFGYTHVEALGGNYHELMAPERYLDVYRKAFVEYQHTGNENAVAKTMELFAKRKDGLEIAVEFSLSTVFLDGGWQAIGIIRDITERMQTEKALKDSERKFRTLIEQVPFPLALADVFGNINYINPWFTETFGYALEGIPTIDIWMNKAYPDAEYRNSVTTLWNDDLKKAHANKTSIPLKEYTVRCKDEAIKTVLITGSFLDENSHLATFIDITLRHQAEEALQKQRQFLSSTLDGLSAHICVIDAHGRIVTTNRSWDMFAIENGAVEECCGTGANYLKACRSSAEKDSSDEDDFATLVSEVIIGISSELVMEYPCHSPTIQRWFICRVNPFTVGEAKFAVVSHENITERKLSEIRLRKLSRAVEQSPATIVITDTNGTIEFVNPRFAKLTGYSPEEAIGQNPRILKSGQTPPDVYEKLWSTIMNGGIWEGELLNKAKDGTLFWEHAVISALRDSNDVITHFLAVKEDVTEKKNFTEQLLIAKEKAEAATQAKSSFLATMSHEIRTPMNGVIGMTNLLLDTDLNAEQRGFADIVRKSGENLLDLINDILDFSKIEAGKMDIEILEFDLRPTIEDTAELLSLRAAEKGLYLICRIDPVVPSYLKGDPGRLRQIITNLVGNAIKFTQQGEIVISASLKTDQDGFVVVLFEVRDTGIGIPVDRLEAVFSAFTQADGSTTRKYGGTGLGLTICKQLASLMGGTIGVSSEFGIGSTFWFTARFEKQTVGIPNPSEVVKQVDISGARILIVDDNATNRMLITTLLGHWGCRYEIAVDGHQALTLLSEAAMASDPFPVALLDQEMPGMDGLELGRRIKNDPILAPTLLIMVTSIGQRGDAASLEKIGFSGYLPKPVRQYQLFDCIALVIGRSVQHNIQIPQTIVTRYTVAEHIKRNIRILLAEDNIINQKVAQNILSKLGYKADVVANGLEAIKALELINYDLVLMDCQMPEMDGFQATTLIRNPESNVINHKVPIIAMTANAMKGDREACIQAGMDDYLSKPVKKEEVAAMLEKWASKA